MDRGVLEEELPYPKVLRHRFLASKYSESIPTFRSLVFSLVKLVGHQISVDETQLLHSFL